MRAIVFRISGECMVQIRMGPNPLSTGTFIPTIPGISWYSSKRSSTSASLLVGFDEVFVIVTESITTEAALLEMPEECVSEINLRDQVIEAHRVLMSLNEQNRTEFQDLVAALEEEQAFCTSPSLAS